MAGKVKLFCFDKTGTLTEDGMEVIGVMSCVEGALVDPALKVEFATHEMYQTLALCHSLVFMDDAQTQLIGDPLEIKMFEFSHASLNDRPADPRVVSVVRIQDPVDGRLRPVEVVKQFPFQPALQRMSVVVRQAPASPASPAEGKGEGKGGAAVYSVHAKGSPEELSKLCRPGSVPADLARVVSKYALRGYRIIACAHKVLPAEPDLGSDDARAQAESQLEFGGLVLFENKVKPETAGVIAQLSQARVRCVMVTGDNAVTATTVAKECGIVEKAAVVYQSELAPGEGGASCVRWVDVADGSRLLDPDTLAPVGGDEPRRYQPFELAVTGACFQHLEAARARGGGGEAMPGDFFDKVIVSSAVFARMSPDQKASLVTHFQRLGLYVGMCGDGANDCGALKAAHVGISLSEAEASIAAPFTYTQPNIECVPLVLAEGRSALNTSFQLFRFMGMYSMIQFGSIILLYFHGKSYGDYQFLLQDLWIVFPLTLLMGRTQASQSLTTKRPSGNLLSWANIINFVCHVFISLAFQIVVLKLTDLQPGYVDVEDEEGIVNWFSTSISYFANLQYVVVAALFASGSPWKQSYVTNVMLSWWLLLALGSSLCILFLSGFQPTVFIFKNDIMIPNDWSVPAAGEGERDWGGGGGYGFGTENEEGGRKKEERGEEQLSRER
jgi:cation-transporting ATPase 13A2